ncbi:MAG: single-stranded DNA-binding protein [Chlorobiaceae bacterium]|jgi:single-strand DNA-binding protein|nr:single-stranded DNA-binding protein [Chlorobiaceae bacterium]NTV16056.1 single-stranded DNA-binding protein [Chlorobiaceae bacterium]
MARGLNKVMLIGRLGGEPESRLAGSTTVANFTIATSEKFKNQQGEVQERTEWHRIVAWGRLAEICKEYLHKGSQVYVEGKLQTRNWEKEGVKQYTTEIVISEMQMLDGKPSGSGQYEGGPTGYERQQTTSDHQLPPAPPSVPMLENEKDDLPF